MLRDGFLTRRWRPFSGSKPPLALARPEKLRRQKMPVSKLRLMRGTTFNTQIEEFIAENVGRR